MIRKFTFPYVERPKVILALFVLSCCFLKVYPQYYHETFESGLNTPPWYLEGKNVTTSQDVSLSGKKSFKAYLPAKRFGRGDNGSAKARSEIRWTGGIKGTPNQHPHFTTWGIKLAIYFPKDFQTDKTSSESIFQFHGVRDQGDTYRSPPFMVRVVGNSFNVTNRWISKKIASEADQHEKTWDISKKIVPGEWHYFVVDVHWDYRENGNGFLKVYLNIGSPASKGDLIVNYTGPTGYNDDLGAYFKMGIYKWDWTDQYKVALSRLAGVRERLLYFDDFEIQAGGFFSGSNGSNKNPKSNAGSDKIITLPTDKIDLEGSASDPDGKVSAYQWTQITGPNQANLKNEDTPTLTASKLVEGAYLFRLTVTDDDGGKDSDDVLVTVEPQLNQDPTANAGPDQTVTLPDNSITLEGKGSDADGSVKKFQWTKKSGPSANLNNQDTENLKVTNLQEGEYVFTLKVTDNDGATAEDNVKVTVLSAPNQDPVANAGNNITTTLPQNSLTLNGTATDSDGSIKSQQWKQISGPTDATMSGENTKSLNLNELIEGTYIFSYTVTDNDGASDTDNVSITVKSAPNQDPVADAGPNRTLTLPTNSIVLNGSGTDPDGKIASYTWTKVSGPTGIIMDDQNTAKLKLSDLVEGKYVFRITVTDDRGAKDNDDIQLVVNPKTNEPPVANAGPNKNITLPKNSLSINGSASDPDGTIKSYHWKQDSGPSSATLSGANTANLSTSGLVAGTYIFKLVVTDDGGLSNEDDMQVVVHPEAANEAPNVDAGPNKTITLPTSTVSLDGTGTDSDGTVSSFKWSQISGPSNADMTGENTPNLTAESLIAGKYVFQLTITDNDGGSSTDNAVVTVNSASNTAPEAVAGPNRSITLPSNQLTITGDASDTDGTINSYEWVQVSGPSTAGMSGNNTNKLVASSLIAGTYVFRLIVIDDDGASGEDEMHVVVHAASDNNQAPTANAGPNRTITLPVKSVILNADASNDPDGSITSFQWEQLSGPGVTLSGAASATLTISDPVEGNYKFGLTVNDNQGAQDTDEVLVIILAPALSIAGDVTDASCSANSGAINLNLQGGKGPFTYNWSNGATTKNLQDLSNGDYEVTVTDSNGDKVTRTFTVENKAAAIKVNATIINTTCDASNGSIKVEASGGTAPYSFEWSSNARTASLNKLAAGSYSLVVKDQNGCSQKFSFKVGVDPEETQHDVISNLQNASCTGNDGKIALKVNGNNDPYRFVWKHGITGPNLNHLQEGKYQVTITDVHGCYMEAEYTISQNPEPEKPSISQSGDSLYVVQTAEQYQWFKDNTPIAGANQRSLKYTEAGTYSVQISNDQQCTASSDDFFAKDPPISGTGSYTMSQVDVYPIPAVEHVNVRLIVNEAASTSMKIYDFQGRLMETKEVGMVNNQIIESVNISQYPSGNYLLQITANQEVITRRFIKH